MMQALVTSPILRGILVLVLFAMPVLPRSEAAEGTPEDESWSDQYFYGGFDGGVTALAVHHDDLYAAGSYTQVDGVACNGVARWNGSGWECTGGPGSGRVRGILSYADELIAFGTFPPVDGIGPGRIAAWNGADWRTLGGGLSGAPRAAVLFEGKLLVGGYLHGAGETPIQGLAAWDGSTWSDLGLQAFAAPSWFRVGVTSLAVWDGLLVVAWETYSDEDGRGPAGVATWDGRSWALLETGENLRLPMALAVWEGNLLRLLRGRNYESPQIVQRWTGDAWAQLGGNFLAPTAGRLLEWSGELLLLFPDHHFRWTGSAWTELPGAAPCCIRAHATLGADLVIGGSFTTVAGEPIAYMARWNGHTWFPFSTREGLGFSRDVTGIATDGDELYVGGIFKNAGGRVVTRMVRRSADGWESLPEPPVDWYWGRPRPMLLRDGRLITSGNDGEVAVLSEGGGWTRIASANGRIHALALLGDDLIAAGKFSRIGSVSVPAGIASWNGSEWRALASGFPAPVRAVCVHDSSVIASSPRGVYRLQGDRWELLGTERDRILTIASVEGDLFASGATWVDAVPPFIGWVERWTGTEWEPIAVDPGLLVETMTSSQGRLVAGGMFRTIGGSSASNVAAYDAGAWIDFGSGTDGEVKVLAAAGQDLFVGGAFVGAGGGPSARFGAWSETIAPPAVIVPMLDSTGVLLRWSAPHKEDVAGVAIRFSPARPPGSITEGEPVPNGHDGFFPMGPGEPGAFYHQWSEHPLEDGRAMHYAFFAVDAEGTVSRSARRSVVVPDRTPPALESLMLPGPRSVQVLLTTSEDLPADRVSLHAGAEAVELRHQPSRWVGLVDLVDVDSLPLVACAVDTAENRSCVVDALSARRIQPGEDATLRSPDGRLSLFVRPADEDRPGGSGSEQFLSVLQRIPDEESAGTGEWVYRLHWLPGSAQVVIAFAIPGSDDPDAPITNVRAFLGDDPLSLAYVDRDRGELIAALPGMGLLRVVVGDSAGAPTIDPNYMQVVGMWPNPSRDVVRCRLDLRARIPVSLDVYDIAGRRVGGAHVPAAGPGPADLRWDGRSADGRTLPAGVYFYRIETAGASRSGRILHIE